MKNLCFSFRFLPRPDTINTRPYFSTSFYKKKIGLGPRLVNHINHIFSNFISRALASKSTLTRSVFSWASSHAFTAVGANNLIKRNFIKVYSSDDMVCADFVWDVRLGHISFNSREDTSMIINSICCD